jgi:hypothetical protein
MASPATQRQGGGNGSKQAHPMRRRVVELDTLSRRLAWRACDAMNVLHFGTS